MLRSVEIAPLEARAYAPLIFSLDGILSGGDGASHVPQFSTNRVQLESKIAV